MRESVGEREEEREREREGKRTYMIRITMISTIIYYNIYVTRERGKTNVCYVIYDCIL